jgi:hypothetical protein
LNYLFHEWRIIQSVVYFHLILVSNDELFNAGIYCVYFLVYIEQKLHKGGENINYPQVHSHANTYKAGIMKSNQKSMIMSNCIIIIIKIIIIIFNKNHY